MVRTVTTLMMLVMFVAVIYGGALFLVLLVRHTLNTVNSEQWTVLWCVVSCHVVSCRRCWPFSSSATRRSSASGTGCTGRTSCPGSARSPGTSCSPATTRSSANRSSTACASFSSARHVSTTTTTTTMTRPLFYITFKSLYNFTVNWMKRQAVQSAGSRSTIRPPLPTRSISLEKPLVHHFWNSLAWTDEIFDLIYAFVKSKIYNTAPSKFLATKSFCSLFLLICLKPVINVNIKVRYVC